MQQVQYLYLRMAKLKFVSVSVGFQKNTRYFNVPSIYLEVRGCNLMCLNGDKPCRLASYEGTEPLTMQYVKKFIKDHNNINHIVIFGGEPLLYKEDLEHFLDDIWKDGMQITIHTNGTLPILNPLPKKHKVALYIVNLSDKNLPHAGEKITINGKEFFYGTNDIEKMQPINIEALRRLCIYSRDYLLCFKGDPALIEEKAYGIVEKICETDEEFLTNFLKEHSPYDHIVYEPRDPFDRSQVMQICRRTGHYYFEPF